jgi:hypothetical protein
LPKVEFELLRSWKLRRGLTIVPQEAFLFTGTVRDNLDPQGNYTDAELNAALELVRASPLTSETLSAKFRLEGEVRSDGGNFSAGEGQLCESGRAGVALRFRAAVLLVATIPIFLQYRMPEVRATRHETVIGGANSDYSSGTDPSDRLPTEDTRPRRSHRQPRPRDRCAHPANHPDRACGNHGAWSHSIALERVVVKYCNLAHPSTHPLPELSS